MRGFAVASDVQPHYIYAFIEEWWGEELGQVLLERISQAPIEHLLEFEREWPSLQAFPPRGSGDYQAADVRTMCNPTVLDPSHSPIGKTGPPTLRSNVTTMSAIELGRHAPT
jgi:hypothetical protein